MSSVALPDRTLHISLPIYFAFSLLFGGRRRTTVMDKGGLHATCGTRPQLSALSGTREVNSFPSSDARRASIMCVPI